VRVQAAVDAFLRIEGLDGGSKDPAHTGWIEITRVVAGDLNGDAMADREAPQPSVSELTVRKAGGTDQAATIGSATSGAGAGKTTAGSASEEKAATNKLMTNSAMIQSPREVATGQASGKRMHKPLVIVKEVDKASPKLYQACASGKHFPSAVVEVGAHQFRLFDVVIASVAKSSGGDRPTEQLTLNFTKIEVVNQRQR
ncbi:MAG TPA: type VI secretion system tube protein Hcp, partial [Candidatus Acidoferrum sp.]